MRKIKAIIASLALFAMFAGTAAQAKVEIQWWHAFGGRLGELLDEQVNKFNASQDKYTVVHTRKGNYSETLNAGIAAFRAGQHPNILMVFEVGTASLMAAKGAYVPMYQLMKDAEKFSKCTHECQQVQKGISIPFAFAASSAFPTLFQVLKSISGSKPAFFIKSLFTQRTGVDELYGIDSILPSVVV